MTHALRYSKIIIALTLCLALFSCHRSTTSGSISPALYPVGNTVDRYDFDITFGKTSQAGVLATRLYNDEIRIICTSYFGLSLFDVTLTPDDYRLNSCIEPLQKEQVWELLSNDFRCLFLPTSNTQTSYDKQENIIRKTGKGITAGKITYSPTAKTTVINHSLLRLKLTLSPTQKEE